MVRFLRSWIPWAVLVLGIGLARQHAAGAGVFGAAEGLVAKARDSFAQLQAEFLPAVEPASPPVVEDAAPTPVVRERFTPPAPSFFPQASRGCRH